MAATKPASDRASVAPETSTRDMHHAAVPGSEPNDMSSPCSLTPSPTPSPTPTPRSPLGATGPHARGPLQASPASHRQRQLPKTNTKEASLAHQALLRRAHNQYPPQPQHKTPNPSQPVLVHPSPKAIDMKKHDARPPSQSSSTPTLPSPQEFSFDEILNSIGPEAYEAIDAIAEICGRSKLSLANQHGSHMPPQGEVEALPILRTEPVADGGRDGPQTRSMAKKLTASNNNNNNNNNAVSANPTAATSPVTSHVHTPGRAKGRAQMETNAALIPQILAWLRGAEEELVPGREDLGAANSLHRILDEAEGARV